MTASVISRRLTMRELTAADYSDAYLAWLQDPEVNGFLETRHGAQTRDTVVDYIEAIQGRPNEVLFGMFLRDGGRHIGNVKAGPIDGYHRVGDVSLFIGDRSVWGSGYATEAIAAASRHAFEALGAMKLSASMYAPNRGSERAFLKAGYRREGWRRGHYMLDGKRCDIIELGLLPGDLVADA